MPFVGRASGCYGAGRSMRPGEIRLWSDEYAGVSCPPGGTATPRQGISTREGAFARPLGDGSAKDGRPVYLSQCSYFLPIATYQDSFTVWTLMVQVLMETTNLASSVLAWILPIQ